MKYKSSKFNQKMKVVSHINYTCLFTKVKEVFYYFFQIPDSRKQILARNGHLHQLTSDVKFEMKLGGANTKLFKFQPVDSKCTMSNVECSEMEGIHCFSSGLGLVYKWNKIELRQKVCKANRIYRQNLPLNATLISILWMSAGSHSKSVDCHVWCTEK